MANFFTNLLNPSKKELKASPFKEIGVSGAVSLNGWVQDREKNSKLSTDQRQVRYEEIAKNVAVVGAGIRMFANLGAGAAWSFEAAPLDTTKESLEWFEAQHEKTEDSWSKIVRHALMYQFFGFSLLEKTAQRDEDGSIFWRAIENRPQVTIKKFYIDDDGVVFAFGQEAPLTGEEIILPRNKCFYIADNLIDDNPAGTGVLRHVFTSTERLEQFQKLETQGFERDLRGVPFARVPYADLTASVEAGEITSEQAQAAITAMENAVKLQVKSSDTGFLLDSKTYSSKSDNGESVSNIFQYDIGTVQGAAPGLPDMGAAIERIQREIARVMGVEGLLLSGGGSQALSKDKSQNLYLGINAALDEIAQQVNKDIIKPLYRLNGIDERLAPKARVQKIDAMDVAEMALVLRDLATAGAPLAPDDDAVNDLRAMMGLSRAEFDDAMTV